MNTSSDTPFNTSRQAGGTCLRTGRLLLRPWREEDAAELYGLARDERIGPAAGWLPHRSVAESRLVIRLVLSAPETYAVELLGTGCLVGCVGLLFPERSNLRIGPHDAEVGYWLGIPYWGRGLIPEAVRALMRRAFGPLGLENLWCCSYAGNHNSLRVQQKCGFRPHHELRDHLSEVTGERRTELVRRITRDEWLQFPDRDR